MRPLVQTLTTLGTCEAGAGGLGSQDSVFSDSRGLASVSNIESQVRRGDRGDTDVM